MHQTHNQFRANITYYKRVCGRTMAHEEGASAPRTHTHTHPHSRTALPNTNALHSCTQPSIMFLGKVRTLCGRVARATRAIIPIDARPCAHTAPTLHWFICTATPRDHKQCAAAVAAAWTFPFPRERARSIEWRRSPWCSWYASWSVPGQSSGVWPRYYGIYIYANSARLWWRVQLDRLVRYSIRRGQRVMRAQHDSKRISLLHDGLDWIARCCWCAVAFGL